MAPGADRPSTSNSISRWSVWAAMARRKSPSVLAWIWSSRSVIVSSVIMPLLGSGLVLQLDLT